MVLHVSQMSDTVMLHLFTPPRGPIRTIHPSFFNTHLVSSCKGQSNKCQQHGNNGGIISNLRPTYYFHITLHIHYIYLDYYTSEMIQKLTIHVMEYFAIAVTSTLYLI